MNTQSIINKFNTLQKKQEYKDFMYKSLLDEIYNSNINEYFMNENPQIFFLILEKTRFINQTILNDICNFVINNFNPCCEIIDSYCSILEKNINQISHHQIQNLKNIRKDYTVYFNNIGMLFKKL